MDIFVYCEELVAGYQRFSRSVANIRAANVSCDVDAVDATAR